MTTSVGSSVFVDTNVLVYATVQEAPLHPVARSALERMSQAGSELWISRQVLREYLAVLSRPQSFTKPLPHPQLVSAVRQFSEQFHVADDSPSVTEHLLSLVSEFAVGGRQIHDANIVATMRAYHIDTLLTHNVDDFSRFRDLIVILPLHARL